MKAKTVTRFVLCAALLLVGASYAPSVHAQQQYRVDNWYYTGCGSNLTLVGHTIYFCGGTSGGWGTTSADWLEVTYTRCSLDVDELPSEVYEWCDGGWDERTTLGDCQCSH
jgi:hypothetical protein